MKSESGNHESMIVFPGFPGFLMKTLRITDCGIASRVRAAHFGLDPAGTDRIHREVICANGERRDAPGRRWRGRWC